MSVNASPHLMTSLFYGSHKWFVTTLRAYHPKIIFEIVDIVVTYFRDLWNFKIDF